MTINQWRRRILECDKLSSKAKLLALALSVYYSPKTKIYPTLTTLEMDCSMTRNTVISATNELKKNNYISVSKHHIHNSSFKINVYNLMSVTSEPMNEPVIEQANERANDGSFISATIEPKVVKVVKKVKEDKKKDKKKITFPTENELHTIFFNELSKRLEKLKLNPASIDKTKAENIFLLFYDYALKYKSTKKAYKDYNSASRTWIGNSLTKMKDFDYDGTMISPQVSNKTPEEIAEDKKKIHDMVIRNKDK